MVVGISCPIVQRHGKKFEPVKDGYRHYFDFEWGRGLDLRDYRLDLLAEAFIQQRLAYILDYLEINHWVQRQGARRPRSNTMKLGCLTPSLSPIPPPVLPSSASDRSFACIKKVSGFSNGLNLIVLSILGLGNIGCPYEIGHLHQ
ncbi:hypothetical protein TIFTF001_012826 [Ficus carica]|uniref:Uncharacterized protein n=1 Tax=Ficus carica TaxID=3494 RepID=A0AA87ZTX8_FICCA|nr:hypothetical protein TIFTF001_012826 [Ficus carica]